MKKEKIFDMSMIAICSAIIVATTFIQVPMPSGVPITLQTFGVAFVGFLLGGKKSTISVLVYIALGFIGIPVFSGASAGIGKILGFTGGFIYGFLPMAFLCGFSNKYKNYIIKIAISMAGLLICHALGAMQYGILAEKDFITSFLLVSAPYLIKDIVSVVAAFAVAKVLSVALSKSGIKVTA